MKIYTVLGLAITAMMLACGGVEIESETALETAKYKSAAKPPKGSVCGDGVCQVDEGFAACPADCPYAGCGDGFCDDTQTCVTNPDGSETCTSGPENCNFCGPDCGECESSGGGGNGGGGGGRGGR